MEKHNANQPELPYFHDPFSDDKAKTPGDYIKLELEKREWGQADLSNIMSRPLPTVNEIIKGKRGITPEMAVSLGEAFKMDPEIWIHREAQYRLSLVKNNDEDTSRRSRLHELLPINIMIKRGWIEGAKSIDKLERQVESFLGNDVEHANARQSVPSEIFSSSQRAWLCRSSEIAKRVNVKSYDKDKFISSLDKIRRFASAPEHASKLPIFMAELGVRLVAIEHLPKTKIDGAAFFLDDNLNNPVISLSLRMDRMNSVWHTFGHEISHIINEDPISIDEEDDPENIQTLHCEVENRANKESADWQIKKADFDGFIEKATPNYTKSSIVRFANRIKIHPSIIVGQLQHRGLLAWSKRADLCPKIKEHFLVTITSDGF